MTRVYVQYTDETKSEIGAVFSSPQNPDVYPNYAEIDEDDTAEFALYTEFLHTSVNPFSL